MTHKTKADRQQEAKERKRRYLDKPEANLVSDVEYATKNPSEKYAAQRVESSHYKLVRAYIEAGYPENEAQGMARSVRAGNTRGQWLSGIDVKL